VPELATRRWQRRTPQDAVLYQVLVEHLETFLEQVHADPARQALPRFVERELREFLACGVLSRGFARVHCSQCGKDELVAFSCKGRGFCPSCGGRRMADFAAHLVDVVLPHVPVRQWVLSLPHRVRFLLAYDADICRDVRAIFVRSVLAWVKARARHTGAPNGRGGAVCFVQRCDSALRVDPHFHVVVLDGVYRLGDDGSVTFAEISAPTPQDLARLVPGVRARITRHLERARALADDALDLEPSAHQACLAAAASGHDARRVRAPLAAAPRPRVRDPHSTDGDGFSLHAGARIGPLARSRLEHLVRYCARPPIATGSLSLTASGHVIGRLKKPWRDGTTHFVLSPLAFIQRLCALVPRPRRPLITYHGVLAPAASWRPLIVPQPPAQMCAPPVHCDAPVAPAPPPRRKRPHRPWHPWAELMKRVFAIDVKVCAWCGGPRKQLTFITQPDVIRRILACLHLDLAPPTLAPARELSADPAR
jgi:hypothetical protein